MLGKARSRGKSKQDETGGTVTVDTVTAQLLYEIQGPLYLGPDVTTDLTSIRLEEVGIDRVVVAGEIVGDRQWQFLFEAGAEVLNQARLDHRALARRQPRGAGERHRAQRRQPRPPLGPADLQRHLDRHLHGDGTRVGEEDVLEPVRRERHEALGEPHGGRVGQPAEHDVRHRVELRGDRRADVRVAVPVAGAPPRAHRVDDLAPGAVAVTEGEAHSLGRLDDVGVLGRERRGVRVPHVGAVEGEQRLEGVGVGVVRLAAHRRPSCRPDFPA